MTITLKALLNIKRGLELEKEELADRIKANGDMIAQHVAAQTAEVRRLQGKEFGAVNAVVEGITVKQTIPKDVKWDKEKMLAIYRRIEASADDPLNFMKAEFSVGEKEYASFIPEIKAIFDEARTVKPGKTTYEFEEVA